MEERPGLLIKFVGPLLCGVCSRGRRITHWANGDNYIQSWRVNGASRRPVIAVQHFPVRTELIFVDYRVENVNIFEVCFVSHRQSLFRPLLRWELWFTFDAHRYKVFWWQFICTTRKAFMYTTFIEVASSIDEIVEGVWLQQASAELEALFDARGYHTSRRVQTYRRTHSVLCFLFVLGTSACLPIKLLFTASFRIKSPGKTRRWFAPAPFFAESDWMPDTFPPRIDADCCEVPVAWGFIPLSWSFTTKSRVECCLSSNAPTKVPSTSSSSGGMIAGKSRLLSNMLTG